MIQAWERKGAGWRAHQLGIQPGFGGPGSLHLLQGGLLAASCLGPASPPSSSPCGVRADRAHLQAGWCSCSPVLLPQRLGLWAQRRLSHVPSDSAHGKPVAQASHCGPPTEALGAALAVRLSEGRGFRGVGEAVPSGHCGEPCRAEKESAQEETEETEVSCNLQQLTGPICARRLRQPGFLSFTHLARALRPGPWLQWAAGCPGERPGQHPGLDRRL